MSKSPKFFVKQACFETRSQSLPNSLVFARGMSDAAKLLIIALNGMCTSGCNWTPRRDDIQNRLEWGREKMTNALKECVEFGYLKIIKNRSAEGEFVPDDYEYDIYPSYLKEKVPSTENPSTVNPSTVKPTLQRTRRDNGEIEEQQQEPVVVPLKKDEEPPPLRIPIHPKLEQIGIAQSDIDYFYAQFGESKVLYAIAYVLSRIDLGDEFSNGPGYLRSAIEGGWKVEPEDEFKVLMIKSNGKSFAHPTDAFNDLTIYADEKQMTFCAGAQSVVYDYSKEGQEKAKRWLDKYNIIYPKRV